jgi:O-antigen ligase/polysaccharide polymerase Wzy-like membrane protein
MSFQVQTPVRHNWIVIAGALSAAMVSLALYWKLQPGLASVIVAGFGFMAVAVARPALAMALLCAVLPIEGIAAGSTHVSEVRLIGIATFAIWLAHLLLYGRRIRINRTFLLGVALALWAGISIMWGTSLETIWSSYFTLVQMLLLFLLTINVIENEMDFRLVLAGLLLGVLVTSPLSMNVFIENVVERARAFEAQNPNGYAMTVGFAIISGLYLMSTEKNRLLRLFFLFSSLFLAVPLILAQSRTAWIATFTAIVVMIWYSRNRVRNYITVVAVMAGLVVVLFAAGLVNFTLVDRTSQLMTMENRGSSRFDVWVVAAEMIKDHPLIGVGYAQFPSSYSQYRGDTPAIRRDTTAKRDPHNTYIGIMGELGIIGLLILLLIFWSACREESLPDPGKAWFSDVVVVFLMMFSIGGTLTHAKLLWIGLALAAKARHLAAERRNDE